MIEFTELIKAVGWPGAILIVLSIGMWRSMAFLKIKLFDDTVNDKTGQKAGIFPRIVDSHTAMIEAVKQTAEDNSRTNHEILLVVKESREEMRSMNRAVEAMTNARIDQHTSVIPPISGILITGRQDIKGK